MPLYGNPAYETLKAGATVTAIISSTAILYNEHCFIFTSPDLSSILLSKGAALHGGSISSSEISLQPMFGCGVACSRAVRMPGFSALQAFQAARYGPPWSDCIRWQNASHLNIPAIVTGHADMAHHETGPNRCGPSGLASCFHDLYWCSACL